MTYNASFQLGTADVLTLLYSYPNNADLHAPNGGEALADTIAHWFGLTLKRDGLAGKITAAVRITATGVYMLDLAGDDGLTSSIDTIGSRLRQFLEQGRIAQGTVIPTIVAAGKWDPKPDAAPYRPWRFFLPHGMAMANHVSLQFFHYPPIRLLEQTRDYLDDPVPARLAELLEANGVTTEAEAWRYETVVDATPVAAADDQGTKAGGDKNWGLIPIQYFPDYQRAMVALLLNAAPNHPGYTIPIVVYGKHPCAIFSNLFHEPVGANTVATVEIIPGMKTAVLGSNHPYMFYGTAQNPVGSGKFTSGPTRGRCVKIMTTDLIVARWQVIMAGDPSQDPQTVLNACTAYWNDSVQAGKICALVRRQGSLSYPDGESLKYCFTVSLEQAAACCSAHGNDAFAPCEPVR